MMKEKLVVLSISCITALLALCLLTIGGCANGNDLSEKNANEEQKQIGGVIKVNDEAKNDDGIPVFETEINGVTVKLIKYNGNDKTVVIPDGVTIIGDSAFDSNETVLSVTIPDSVKKIERNAFVSCISLNDLTIPESVIEIYGGAFAGCISLKRIEIPDGVVKLSTNLFQNCVALKDVTIPGNLVQIEWGTFGNCMSLTNINIPDSVKEIGDNAFWGCISLTDEIKEKISDINPEAEF